MLNKKTLFIPGMGKMPLKEKRFISKYMKVANINWNNPKLDFKGYDTIVAFSFGCVLALDYALKNKVKRLILCSPTTGIETLAKVKAEEIIFMAGSKERWVIQETDRVSATFKGNKQFIEIEGADHQIVDNYARNLIDLVVE